MQRKEAGQVRVYVYGLGFILGRLCEKCGNFEFSGHKQTYSGFWSYDGDGFYQLYDSDADVFLARHLEWMKSGR